MAMEATVRDSTSQRSQLRVDTRTMSALSAEQLKVSHLPSLVEMQRRVVAPSHPLGVNLGQRVLKTRSEFKLLGINVASTNLREVSIEVLVVKSAGASKRLDMVDILPSLSDVSPEKASVENVPTTCWTESSWPTRSKTTAAPDR